MIRSMAFLSGFPGGNCKLKHRRDFDDEKNKPETGAFALGAGSVFCGVRFGAPNWQFSVEQQRHLWRLSGIYLADRGAPLGTIWEKTEVII